MASADHLAPQVEAWRMAHPIEGFIDLQVGDVAIRVHSNDAAVLADLRTYYATFLCEPQTPDLELTALETDPLDVPWELIPAPLAPGKTRIKDETRDFADGRLLRKRLTGMVFTFGRVPSVVLGPCRSNLNQVVNFVHNRFTQRKLDEGYLLCHAAGVAHKQRGMLLAGLSGRGKSTLALHLLNKGLDYISNDRLLICRDGRTVEMLGLPKLPRVNPGTILYNPRLADMIPADERRKLSALPDDQLWKLEQKYDVDIPARYGPDRFRLTAELAGIMVLTWTRGEQGVQVRPVKLRTRADLLAAIMKSPGVHYLPPSPDPAEHTPAAYLEALRPIPTWEVGGAVDFESAAQACVNHLREAGV